MKKINKIFLAVIFFLVNFQFTFAELGLVPTEKGDYKELAKAFETGEFSLDLIGQYFVFLIDVFSQLAVMISFLFVLIGAFRYTISYLEGDEGGENAKKTIKNALIGLAISTLAYVIVDIFVRFLM